MSKKLADDTEYYVTSGGKVPVKWTAPEVGIVIQDKVILNIYYVHTYVPEHTMCAG